ncbi:hypothetical protein TNIN_329201 [Trichonephila inaurata madagascariensis]|uniref:Uncharacterized protein n=1 Tax=Trichonephila inaurata madagascariensis TaxID=2747483 RepID=A0A8X6WR53_9ARAC|nr:hypothetical protein TNIN_329201 [Trichonephila inaurata madagascariensis]
MIRFERGWFRCVFLDRQIMVTAQIQMRMEMAPLLKEGPGTDSRIRSKDAGRSSAALSSGSERAERVKRPHSAKRTSFLKIGGPFETCITC